MSGMEEDLVDYQEGNEVVEDGSYGANGKYDETKKGNYVGIQATGFRDFLLKPELLRAIVDCGFEHPSEVQHECIPQSILANDILCQAKSGMGKTAVFVLATLQQLPNVPSEEEKGRVKVLVICHTRELAYQIRSEYVRFSKYIPGVMSSVLYGGVSIDEDKKKLQEDRPQIIIGTPGRVLSLIQSKDLDLSHLGHFVLDECDKCLEKLDMRRDVQRIFMNTPKKKQVMMFSATMAPDLREVAKKFMNQPHEIQVDDETKLTLHGLIQHVVEVNEPDKNKKLKEVLDLLEFNQIVIFVKSVARATALNKLLNECRFPSICIHSGLKQDERIERYKSFKEFTKRIMVATDLFGRGIDIERINIVINYDMPESSDQYLHRVGRAGRFGTKGLSVTFVGSAEDKEILKAVQSRFECKVTTMPAHIDSTTYVNA